MAQIFVSYAHADHALLEKFLEALRPVADRLDLVLWWDEELQAGQKWDARIRAALDASDVFVCFVTNAFLKPSGYILKTELPMIRAAEKSRGALVLPVIAEPSHWDLEFADTQAVPKTKARKPGLRPISKWNQKQEGFHEASLQLKRPIVDFLNAMPPRPDPGPGPAMAPTPAGFAIIGRPPSEVERADPSLKGHHDDILDALAEIEPHLDRLGNVDPKLVKAVRTYAEAARKPFAEVPLDRLWSLGGRLCERIETLSNPELAEIFEARTLRDLTGELHRLRDVHAVLMMSTEQGRELTGKVAAYRSSSTPLATTERSAHAVLAAMTGQKGLLEPVTRKFVGAVAEPLGEGTERVDEIEAGLRTALHAVTAFFGALEPLVRAGPSRRTDEARIRDDFASDPNLATFIAAFAYIERHEATIAAFAAENPDLRRYVERTLGGLAGKRVAMTVDLDEPPADFDEDVVRDMILSGQDVPKDWVPYVRNLEFAGVTLFDNLTSLTPYRNLETLDISGTGVTDLAPLGKLRKLALLQVTRPSVADLKPLAKLQTLTDVNLLGATVADLAVLAELKNLKALYISETGIVDFALLARLSGLETLFLSSTSIADLAPLADLQNLELLYVSNTPVSDLTPLAQLQNLRGIYVSNTLVSDLTPLSGLQNLKAVYVSKTSVSDLTPLSGLQNLERLSVEYTAVAELSPLTGLQNLHSLHVSNTSVADLAPLAGLLQITTLDISGTQVNDLRVFGLLDKLENVEATDLTDLIEIPTVWPASLRQLNLRGSHWPADRPLPEVPWRVAPDGTIRRGGGDDPFPFRFWVEALEPRAPSPPEG
ncbi:TIR domain-containing protein [Siculibacillus lacustris]|uniref:TIR domain-containing protein n=1 Tax=Siculibacillus lacustris TaxID=1549641 RepID=A0A4Q9VIM1_9HYPH|nr:leucine-rich repeat domain-containing protein [Siculibacillus lacustris]TBW35102.1 TIR domain-containing protein [Siculibacillus lacustris]